MGCCITKDTKPGSPQDFNNSGPLHFDDALRIEGPGAPLYDKLQYTIQAFVTSVYDGDTFTAAVKHNNSIVREKCRVNGIDTPEMKPPKDQANREDEKAKAREAKQIVEAALLEKYIKLNVLGRDKYGRLLVKVSCPDTGKDIGDILIEKGLAYHYDGGTKQKFSS